MTSQCSVRHIWHAWTNLRARRHTTGRLRAPHTQESPCGSSQHWRCSNRSRPPGRASCKGTTAGLPRPKIVRCGSRSSGLGRARLLQRRTAAQRRILRHQPRPRDPAAAAAAGCRQRQPRAAPRPRAAPQVCHAVLRIYRSLTGIDHFFYSSVGGMVKWYEKWYMTLLIIFEWNFDCFNIIRHFVCAEGQIFLSSRQKLGRGHVGECTNQQYMAQIWRFRAHNLLFRPPGAADQLLVG